jgi:WXXGXW repeat (2 copies)
MTGKPVRYLLIPAVVAAAGSLMFVGGCVERRPQRVVYVNSPPPYQPQPDEVIVQQEPPADNPDVVVGVAPGPDYVWVGGFYAWDGSRYAWRRGEWRRPVRPGMVWERDRYERSNGGWRHVQGHWR